ncbi:MAG: hypothetical protein AAB600_02170 [Patescibacteria group bacterium]
MKNFQRGQSLVELLLAIGLSAILLPALLTGFLASREGKAQHSQRTEAVSLLKTTVAAVRSVREKAWDSFATNGTFHPEVAGSSWTLVVGSDTINGFTRQVDISDVKRDVNGAIALAGTTDTSTKKVVITVSWGAPYPSSINSTLYMTRYLGNNAFLQTTVADFNLGTRSATVVTNNSGGEITLGPVGLRADWCTPSLTIAALDLPKSGVANALTAIEGRAFAGTGDNASGISFAKVSISNANPPVSAISATFDGYKTNGVFGETNYAYLATDNNFKEIVIIDLNNIVAGKYQEAGFFNAPGNGDGNSLFVSGNTGYMIHENGGNKLYSFDLSSKSGSRPILDPDGVTLAGDGNKVYIVGSYAYVATSSTTNQLQIFNISNPNNLTLEGQTGSLNDQGAKDVFVNSSQTRAYVVTSASSTQKEFFIIDVSNKTSPVLVSGGSYETSEMSPKGVTVVTNNKAVIVGTGGEEYQVINIQTESSPTRCGGLNVDTGINGVSSVVEADSDAYSYIITGDVTAEFKIVEGGPGGLFGNLGDFTSSAIDAGYPSSFNRFDVSVIRPAQTDIKFQVATSDPVGGSCNGAAYTFVGPPDATPSTYFETLVNAALTNYSYTIPLSLSPKRCFKYKAYLSTQDIASAPTLYDVTLNYAP